MGLFNITCFQYLQIPCECEVSRKNKVSLGEGGKKKMPRPASSKIFRTLSASTSRSVSMVFPSEQTRMISQCVDLSVQFQLELDKINAEEGILNATPAKL